MQEKLSAVPIRKPLEGQLVSGTECRKKRRVIDLSQSAGVGCHGSVPILGRPNRSVACRDEALGRVVQQSRPLIARKVQVQAAKRPDATNGDRDDMRDARHDSRVEKDTSAGYRPDVDQGRLLIRLSAPTEPQVTNVTSTSAARVAVGDDQRIPVGMLLEPAPCRIVEFDDEVAHPAIMRAPAYTTDASGGCHAQNGPRR